MLEHAVADREIERSVGFGDFAAGARVQRRINVSTSRLFDLPRVGINTDELAVTNALQEYRSQLSVAAAKIEAAAHRDTKTCECGHLDRAPQRCRRLEGVFGEKLHGKICFHG